LSDGFDPVGEYTDQAWGLYSQLLLRTLVTYRHVAGPAGTEVVPDLATDTGQVSGHGLTYTFHLKPGLRFAPPVGRPITSRDVEFAFERLATQSLAAEYPFYYQGTIQGFEVHPGRPTPISGIETPDPSTVVFRLTQPTGDFVQRLTLPATAPVPREVAGCFQGTGGYGRDLVSTGPYMIRGADQVDISTCSAIRPMEGFDPASKLILVRNPDYDPTTDSPEVRENFIDGVHITVDPSVNDIFRRIRAGTLDGSLATTPPDTVVQTYLGDPSLRPLLHSDPFDATYYLTMNLLTPPFDDVHVRRAVNWAIDKQALQRAFGGRVHQEIATNAFPPDVLPTAAGFDPYPSPHHRGDIAAAHAEIALSRYDTNGDGVCDAPACQGVLFVTRNYGGYVSAVPVIERSLSPLGITLRVKELDTGTAYTTIETVENLVPFAGVPGWLKDYPDPYTFADFLFHSGSACYGNVNYANIGMTRDLARQCGVLPEWQAARPPSLDAAVAACEALAGAERSGCWTRFDAKLMRVVVPWVPYRWARTITIVAPSVTTYEFDQFSATISLCHVALALSRT